jgi:hypothetical protein
MEVETSQSDPADDSTTNQQELQPTNKTGRPPPIVLTSQVNLIQLQKCLKSVTKSDFELRSTKNGTRVVTKEMADFSAIKSHFDTQNLQYFTFYLKFQKPIKAVIRHLPSNTPAEDISDGLVDLGYDIISVKQMSTTRQSSTEGPSSINLPLFLFTLPRSTKSQEIFKLTGLCHISIKAEAYKAQNNLTQCYNCQKFGHVWANCKLPLCCLWCGGGHLHKDCPEKRNIESKPMCCNCKLGDGEELHPSNY